MFIIADDHQKNFSQSALLICGRSRGDMRTTFSLRYGMVSRYEMPSHITQSSELDVAYTLARFFQQGSIEPLEENLSQ
jgi:hypothetical protein